MCYLEYEVGEKEKNRRLNKHDRSRNKEEQEKARVRQVRKNALAKLTDEERKILGI